ncbi:MAG: hypothetical protein JO257_21390 [Deltaproteobacteria bacterium]|nr:hypothetical protein [Deltaproteobacteria bacterium]
MRFAALGCLLLLGCGRLGFDPRGSADGSGKAADATGGNGDGSVDGAVDASVDGVAAAVCGNGVCEGSAGELCSGCSMDCNVTTIVCGNEQCEAGEDGTTCPADCGPSPWPWGAEDTSLLNDVNTARTGGVMCPGDSTPRVAAAVVFTPTLQQGSREMVWEIAHGKFYANGSSCNGRTFAQRLAAYGGNGYAALELSTTGPFATTADVVNAWKTDIATCTALMSPSTQASTSVAHDSWHGYVLWFK